MCQPKTTWNANHVWDAYEHSWNACKARGLYRHSSFICNLSTGSPNNSNYFRALWKGIFSTKTEFYGALRNKMSPNAVECKMHIVHACKAPLDEESGCGQGNEEVPRHEEKKQIVNYMLFPQVCCLHEELCQSDYVLERKDTGQTFH